MIDRYFPFIIGFLVIILITVPYIYAQSIPDSDYVFSGLLMNHQDGYSYLAKMYQGWSGKWSFNLPFNSTQGSGGFLFVYHIVLGHISRVLNLPMLFVYHSARIFGSVFLLLSLWIFLGLVFTNNRDKQIAFTLTSLGSGLGWLFLPFGEITSDFWVAEAYPFLSAYTNPHFPLGLALLLFIFSYTIKRVRIYKIPESKYKYDNLLFIIFTVVLAEIMPFGIVIAILVIIISYIFYYLEGFTDQSWIKKFGLLNWLKKLSITKPSLILFIGGAPILLYSFWLVNNDPILAGWNEQNITTSPPPWDLVISLSPSLLLFFPWAWNFLNYKRNDSTQQRRYIDWMLLVWVGMGFVLLYLPFNLQRRFMMGLFIPISIGAVRGISLLSQRGSRVYKYLLPMLLIFSLPSNLILFIGARNAVNNHDPSVFITKDEESMLYWIAENVPAESLILASPETSLFIPSFSGNRVVYAHPFETVNAAEKKQQVINLFEGNLDDRQLVNYLNSTGVDYLVYGPRENKYGNLKLPAELEYIMNFGDILFFQFNY